MRTRNDEMISWKEGTIHDCPIRPLRKYHDDRGWLAEVFRHDELDASLHPTMAYLSLTEPGVERGPHEHDDQTDLFVFFNGTFRVYLWDSREDSPTFGVRCVVDLGESNPAAVIVPPGVVHAYRNVGGKEAMIFNCPNRLYGGWDRKEVVDEIRHEDRDDDLYSMD
jgi:dTDP-4-dehydrorhamnose 3,5-epimerase